MQAVGLDLHRRVEVVEEVVVGDVDVAAQIIEGMGGSGNDGLIGHERQHRLRRNREVRRVDRAAAIPEGGRIDHGDAAALNADAAPHRGARVGVVASPVTLIGTGTSVVIAVDVSS